MVGVGRRALRERRASFARLRRSVIWVGSESEVVVSWWRMEWRSSSVDMVGFSGVGECGIEWLIGQGLEDILPKMRIT